jgi:hypothetical protein
MSQLVKAIKRIHFCFIKLPSIYLLITLGILADFVVQLPFILLCELDNIFQRRV